MPFIGYLVVSLTRRSQSWQCGDGARPDQGNLNLLSLLCKFSRIRTPIPVSSVNRINNVPEDSHSLYILTFQEWITKKFGSWSITSTLQCLPMVRASKSSWKILWFSLLSPLSSHSWAISSKFMNIATKLTDTNAENISGLICQELQYTFSLALTLRDVLDISLFTNLNLEI